MKYIHHSEVRMLLDARFLDPQSRVALQQLINNKIRYDRSIQYYGTHTADETLGILIHRLIVWELQLILQHSVVHVRVIISPEWSLRRQDQR